MRCRSPEDVAANAACPVCLFKLALEPARGWANLAEDAWTGVQPWKDAGAHPLRIGPYRIVTVLGEGGMGVVYLAEQEQPIRRRVALKVIKLGMDTREVIARFEAERQALALMDHPNIARVLDAGATGRGPAVLRDGAACAGVPITDYCDEQPAHDPRAARAVHHGLPGGAARPPEGHHPSRPQAVERARGRARRPRRCPKVIDFGDRQGHAASG